VRAARHGHQSGSPRGQVVSVRARACACVCVRVHVRVWPARAGYRMPGETPARIRWPELSPEAMAVLLQSKEATFVASQKDEKPRAWLPAKPGTHGRSFVRARKPRPWRPKKPGCHARGFSILEKPHPQHTVAWVLRSHGV
jgi:hypothetical protein